LEEKYYRNEYKHSISQETRITLHSRLKKFLPMDVHSQGKSYLIKNLYFDTLYDDALNEKLNGDPYREKFRIRCYNNDYNYIRLEKKVKEIRKGYKLSTKLAKKDIQKILLGDIEFLKDKDDSLQKEFYVKMKTKVLLPKIIIQYQREAYTFRPGNTRITLDYNIRCSINPTDFFNDTLSYLEIEPHKCVLEVKFDHFLPEIIRDLIQVNETTSTANSKYASGRLFTLNA